ncbi:MAG: chaperone modulator CbpM [Geminicoccaceae bacterium]
MKTIEEVCRELGCVEVTEIRAWIAAEWVRPPQTAGEPAFRDVDVARVHLLADLRHDLALDEEAVPVVLSLMDQLYDTRRRMRALVDAVLARSEAEHKAVLEHYRRLVSAAAPDET